MWRKGHKTPQYLWDRNWYGPKLNYLFLVLPGLVKPEAEVVQNRQFIPTEITSKILGGHYLGRPPFINIGGVTCPLCLIGIDAPVYVDD